MPGAPPLGPGALKTQFLEVAAEFCRQGIATEGVAGLSDAHPDRRLCAFSEYADEWGVGKDGATDRTRGLSRWGGCTDDGWMVERPTLWSLGTAPHR